MMVVIVMYTVSRTHTLLLVDRAGRCEYIEETMVSDALNANPGLSVDERPSRVGKQPSDWKTAHFNFTFTWILELLYDNL